MGDSPIKSRQTLWAEFRFAAIGQLLSSPPPKGELKMAITELANKRWRHPTIPGQELQVSRPTLERWYYQALRDRSSPMEALKKRCRSDVGRSRKMSEEAKKILLDLYDNYQHWSYQLHRDNLQVALKSAGLPTPSYSTVRRYLLSLGKRKVAKKKNRDRPGYQRSLEKRAHFECRSFENQYVNGLWHLDFHHCSRSVITTAGEIIYPVALGVLDDHSRLICHLQWYLAESAVNLVHGFKQALLKRNMPRKLLTDNGSAMLSQEFTQGLTRLSILHETTLPYSPNQNGKQEIFWGQLEGRLIAMLERQRSLTLQQLNDLSTVWVEKDYNHGVHREIKATPYERFISSGDVSRKSLPMDELELAFMRDEKRLLRSSDCTISLGGKRFEVPSQYRHLRELVVRYASWDLSRVYLVDRQSGKILSKIFPLDKVANSISGRKSMEVIKLAPTNSDEDALPPLLQAMYQDHLDAGDIATYLPKDH